MEKIIQRLLVLTGIFIGAAVALTPITTYAETSQCRAEGEDLSEIIAEEEGDSDIETGEEPYKSGANSGNTNVCIYVDSVISLDAISSKTINVFLGKIAEGELVVNVRSAMAYTITISAEEPELTETSSQSFFIPARSEIVSGKVGWGIRKYGQTENYTAVAPVAQVFFDSTINDNGTGTDVADVSTPHTFPIGVSVTENIPQGTYATDIEVTAAVKE